MRSYQERLEEEKEPYLRDKEILSTCIEGEYSTHLFVKAYGARSLDQIKEETDNVLAEFDGKIATIQNEIDWCESTPEKTFWQYLVSKKWL
jgi:hypothetical protein